MATLGDPTADLAVALVYWTDPEDGLRSEVPVAEQITDQRGFWGRERIIERYSSLTGNPLGCRWTFVQVSRASNSP